MNLFIFQQISQILQIFTIFRVIREIRSLGDWLEAGKDSWEGRLRPLLGAENVKNRKESTPKKALTFLYFSV